MAIRIHACDPVAGGCKVMLLPDADNAVAYFQSACAKYGWRLGVPTPSDGTRMVTVHLEGPTAQEFKSRFVTDPEFDFSYCRRA